MRQTKWLIVLIFGLSVLGGLLPVHRAFAYQGNTWRCVEVNGQANLNVRSGPGENYPVIGNRQAGDQLEADYSRVQTVGGYNWVPVRFAGGEGWVITARLSPCASEFADPAHDVVLNEIDQDGVLDRDEIAAIGRCVVLLVNIQNGKIESSGTGTITTPDGLIITNAHVVEGAELVGIGVLNDINDPAEFTYVGEVVGISEQYDVALVAIRYDLQGALVDSAALNLPYLPATVRADEVFRGDEVYIFGYPGIGDDYLVVTRGTIVSVENGTMNDQRLPIWYRTDAEIAPGNSGGLVVNGNGEFIGIPTFVASESETGGRLGGIRPAQVALMAILGPDEQTVVGEPEPTLPASDQVWVQLQAVDTRHDAVVNGAPGIEIHLSFVIGGWQGQNATVSARFYFDDTRSLPLTNPKAPGQYRDKNNLVLTSVPIAPCCAETLYNDLVLFIPYTALGLTPGSYQLQYQVDVANEEASWSYTLTRQSFVYTRP